MEISSKEEELLERSLTQLKRGRGLHANALSMFLYDAEHIVYGAWRDKQLDARNSCMAIASKLPRDTSLSGAILLLEAGELYRHDYDYENELLRAMNHLENSLCKVQAAYETPFLVMHGEIEAEEPFSDVLVHLLFIVGPRMNQEKRELIETYVIGHANTIWSGEANE